MATFEDVTDEERVIWEQRHVVDVRDAAFAARTFYEHRDLRRLLSSQLSSTRLRSGCEVGAGFGRMTPILSEYCDNVVGFEREAAFVAEAAPLFPFISFQCVESLDHLPVGDSAFDLVLTFTVLQHLVDAMCKSVARELARIIRPGGFLAICEETDPSHLTGDTLDPKGMCTIGRSVGVYSEFLDGFELICTQSRVIEPTYPRPDVGTYMFFRRKRGVWYSLAHKAQALFGTTP